MKSYVDYDIVLNDKVICSKVDAACFSGVPYQIKDTQKNGAILRYYLPQATLKAAKLDVFGVKVLEWINSLGEIISVVTNDAGEFILEDHEVSTGGGYKPEATKPTPCYIIESVFKTKYDKLSGEGYDKHLLLWAILRALAETPSCMLQVEALSHKFKLSVIEAYSLYNSIKYPSSSSGHYKVGNPYNTMMTTELLIQNLYDTKKYKSTIEVLATGKLVDLTTHKNLLSKYGLKSIEFNKALSAKSKEGVKYMLNLMRGEVIPAKVLKQAGEEAEEQAKAKQDLGARLRCGVECYVDY